VDGWNGGWVIGLQVTSPKGHGSEGSLVRHFRRSSEQYHMIDVSSDSVRQSQHALTLILTLTLTITLILSLTLTLKPNSVTLRTSELSLVIVNNVFFRQTISHDIQ